MGITAAIMILASLAWAIVDWYSFNRILQPAIEVTGTIVGIIFLLWQRKVKNFDLRTQIFVGIISLFLLLINCSFIISHGVINTNTPWLFLIPLFSFFISGEQDGLFWSVTTLLWLLTFALLGFLGIVGESANMEQFLDLLNVYLLVALFSFFYERARRQTQVKLKEIKEFNEDIVTHAPLGIYIINKEGIIESFNPAMEKIVQASQLRNEKVGANVFELEAYEKFGLARLLRQTLRTGKDLVIDNLKLISSITGKASYRRYHGIPLRDKENEIIRLLLLVEDSTALRDIESGREALIHELSHKNEDLERFVYVVSHDLRSPLTSLRGYLDEIRDSLEQGNQKQLENDLQNLDKIATNMGQMIDDLLSLSRIGKQKCERESVDLNELIGQVLDNVDIQLKEKGFQVKVQPHLPTLVVYRRALEETFSNLISNAIKFTEDKNDPFIKIGYEERENEYCFCVKDNGVGISPKNQGELFELFFRYGKKQGSGIGLSIVKQYVGLHNGHVWVKSKEGKGSAFWFSIPKD